MNFSQTNWETLSSSNPYEIQTLEKIFLLNLTKHSKIQLDIVLSSKTWLIVICQVDKLLLKILSDPFSDNKPNASTLLSTTDCELNKLKNDQYAFKTGDWDGLTDAIKRQSFAPYFSSVNKVQTRVWLVFGKNWDVSTQSYWPQNEAPTLDFRKHMEPHE